MVNLALTYFEIMEKDFTGIIALVKDEDSKRIMAIYSNFDPLNKEYSEGVSGEKVVYVNQTEVMELPSFEIAVKMLESAGYTSFLQKNFTQLDVLKVLVKELGNLVDSNEYIENIDDRVELKDGLIHCDYILYDMFQEMGVPVTFIDETRDNHDLMLYDGKQKMYLKAETKSHKIWMDCKEFWYNFSELMTEEEYNQSSQALTPKEAQYKVVDYLKNIELSSGAVSEEDPDTGNIYVDGMAEEILNSIGIAIKDNDSGLKDTDIVDKDGFITLIKGSEAIKVKAHVIPNRHNPYEFGNEVLLDIDSLTEATKHWRIN